MSFKLDVIMSRQSVPLSMLLYQGKRELVNRSMRRLTIIRSLKEKLYKDRDVEHESCAGDTDCCRIIYWEV